MKACPVCELSPPECRGCLTKRAAVCEDLAEEYFNRSLEMEQALNETTGQLRMVLACLRDAEEECEELRRRVNRLRDDMGNWTVAYGRANRERDRLQALLETERAERGQLESRLDAAVSNQAALLSDVGRLQALLGAERRAHEAAQERWARQVRGLTGEELLD